jgi:pyruvate ferredoxin oxidoreductase alpha subunit
LDTVLMAYKIAEDKRIRIPVAVGYDGYVLSYTAEPVEIPDQGKVDDWLPPNKAIPSYLPGEQEAPSRIREPWKEHHEIIVNSKKIIMEVNESYRKTFGRGYGNGLTETYRSENADAILVAMGSIAGTARAAVDRLWEDGKKVGLVKLKCFLPFPVEDFKVYGEKYNAIGMIDRNICLGHGGAGYRLIRDTLYDLDDRPSVLQFHAGMAGKEVRVDDVYDIGEKVLEVAKGGKITTFVNWV